MPSKKRWLTNPRILCSSGRMNFSRTLIDWSSSSFTRHVLIVLLHIGASFLTAAAFLQVLSPSSYLDLSLCRSLKCLSGLTLFHTGSENPYHSRGSLQGPPTCISGTLTYRMTKLGGNTHLGINSLYRAFNALKINSYGLKMPEISLKGPTKVFKLKTKIS